MSKDSRSEGAMKNEFRKFIWYVWVKILILPAPTRVQYDICKFLANGPRKRVIHAFRGVGKSFLTATYVVWRLWKNPNVKVLVVSANEKYATEIATFIHLLINTIPFLQHLKPRHGQRDSVLAFDVGPAKPDKSPSVKAVGVLGQMTGSRADIVLFDDPEVPKNAETEKQREKLTARISEGPGSVLKPEGEVIFLGTPQSQETVYRALPEKGYTVRIWPSRYPKKDLREIYGDQLAPMLIKDIERDPSLMEPIGGTDSGGVPTDPERFDHEDLLEREAEYTPAPFMLQFMLDTRLSDADRYPLKARDLIVMDVDPKKAPVQLTWASGPNQMIEGLQNLGFTGDRYYRPMWTSDDYLDYTGSVMVIDPSGRGADETSFAVTKFLEGVVHARRNGGFKDGFGKATLEGLARIARKEKVNTILIEDNFGDGMFTALFMPVLTKIYPCSIEEYKSTGQKELRIINALKPVMKQHRLVVDKTLLEDDFKYTESNEYRLGYQLTHLTADRGSLKHDDRLETLAKAVAHWVPDMDINTEESEKRHKERLKEKAIEAFIRAAGGSVPNRNNYLGGRLKRRH